MFALINKSDDIATCSRLSSGNALGGLETVAGILMDGSCHIVGPCVQQVSHYFPSFCLVQALAWVLSGR